MFGKRYHIKHGDTLWSIAREHFGHGAQWPRIWRYNNRRDVIRAMGHGIPDPDLIYAGRTILIPVLPHEPRNVGKRKKHHPSPAVNARKLVPTVPLRPAPSRAQPVPAWPAPSQARPVPTGPASQARPQLPYARPGEPRPAQPPPHVLVEDGHACLPARPFSPYGQPTPIYPHPAFPPKQQDLDDLAAYMKEIAPELKDAELLKLKNVLSEIRSPIGFKYSLPTHPVATLDTPAARVEFAVQGNVLMMTRKAYPVTYVRSDLRIESQVQYEADRALGALIGGDNRVIFDPKTKQVTVRSMLVSLSNQREMPTTALGVEMDASNPIPKLRAEIKIPKLEGRIGPFNYIAWDVSFVILITPKPGGPAAPSMRVARQPQVAIQEKPEPTNWWRWLAELLGIVLVVTAVVIVVVTVVEDILTLGAGMADDPASFALAYAAWTRGLAMIGGATLPRALPAAVRIRATFELAGAR